MGVSDAVGASVVALKSECIIAPRARQVIVENAAANPEIGSNVEQVVMGSADFTEPERHDLHESLGANRRDGKPVKTALDIDDGHYEFRGDVRLPGCFMNCDEKVEALCPIGEVRLEPSRHDVQPDAGDVAVPETMIVVRKGFAEVGFEGRVVAREGSGVGTHDEPQEEGGE